MPITVNSKQVQEMLVDCLKARLVPMLVGPPGVGKSAIVSDIAKQYRLKVIDVRLSQTEPTDMLGLPAKKEDINRGTYLPMETFPLEGDPLPEGYEGWLLFLDEFNSATMSTQAAAYKLTLDRLVGQEKLHDNVVIMCAGNLSTDNAIVNRLSTAMQSRLIHLEMHVDHEEWLQWAAAKQIDPRITSYIRFKPTNLHSFDPNHNDKTFACPRTWEFLNMLIKDKEELTRHHIPLLAGTVSEGVAREFVGFTKVFKDLPTVHQIVNNPTGIKVPDDPSTLYALSGALACYFKEDNAEDLIKYISRMPPEFSIITLKDVNKRNPDVAKIPAVSKWITTNVNRYL